MSTPSKRPRDEDEVDVAIQELEAAVGREDADLKIKALQRLSELIDPADESYEVQKRAATDGVLNALMQLLEDDNEAVAIESAKVLAALVSHSAAALDRLSVGKTTGYSGETPGKVALNPVQDAVAELDGLISVLVNMKFSDSPDLSEAGETALSAICAFNRENTVNYLREAVHRLQQGESKALDTIDTLLGGLEVRDDVAVLLDQILTPVLGFLRTGSAAEKLDAVTLLGDLCEARRGAAAFVVAEGALSHVAGLIVKSNVETQDAAARAAWLLVKDDRKLLSPQKDALGVPGTKLVEPLLKLAKAGAAAEEAEAHGDFKQGEGASVVENSDDATLLLKALAAQDDDVREKLRDDSLVRGPSCCIM